MGESTVLTLVRIGSASLSGMVASHYAGEKAREGRRGYSEVLHHERSSAAYPRLPNEHETMGQTVVTYGLMA